MNEKKEFPRQKGRSDFLHKDEVISIHKEILTAQRRYKYEEAVSLNQKLTNSTPLSFLVRQERYKAQTQSSKESKKIVVQQSQKPRKLIISLPYLSENFNNFTLQDLENSLMFFNTPPESIIRDPECKYSDDLQARKGRVKLCKIREELIEILIRKENSRPKTVFWLGVDGDYNAASQWLTKIRDPVTGKNYKPLLLTSTFWRRKWNVERSARFTKSCEKVILNMKNAGCEPNSTMELFLQSNNTLDIVDCGGRRNWK